MRPGSGGARAPARDDIRQAAAVYRAPEALRRQLRSTLRRSAAASAPTALRAPGWLAYAASILIAVAVGSGGTVLLTGERQNDTIANEVIDSHLRSLLGTHLTDVASSDKHTVKPWFAGRTDLSPPGVDLAAKGFPLIGGRLDLVQGKPIPALVYRAGKHIIKSSSCRPGQAISVRPSPAAAIRCVTGMKATSATGLSPTRPPTSTKNSSTTSVPLVAGDSQPAAGG